MKTELILLAMCLAGGSSLAHSADDAGITVSGVGEARVKPTHVEFEFRAAGTAELAGDAIVKYRDALRRMSAAFAALKIKDLTTTERDLSYTEAGAMGNANALALAIGGNNPPGAKPQVQISRGLQVSLANIDKLSEQELMEHIAKILDTAKDAGAKASGGGNALLARMMGEMGSGASSAVATFVVPSADVAREQAYQKAFAQAQSRAERLAALAGVKLGRVLSVQEEQVNSGAAGDQQSAQMQMIAAIYGSGGEGAKPQDPTSSRITSEKYEEIPVRVGLRVRFEIQAKNER